MSTWRETCSSEQIQSGWYGEAFLNVPKANQPFLKLWVIHLISSLHETSTLQVQREKKHLPLNQGSQTPKPTVEIHNWEAWVFFIPDMLQSLCLNTQTIHLLSFKSTSKFASLYESLYCDLLASKINALMHKAVKNNISGMWSIISHLQHIFQKAGYLLVSTDTKPEQLYKMHINMEGK